MPSINPDVLTPREREILILIAEGDSLPEIARRLRRSTKTIESHRLSLGRKLGVSNRVELARLAIGWGLVSVPREADGEITAKHEVGVDAELELRWLNEISEAVRDVTGRQYIQALCSALTRVLGVRYSAVCTSAPSPGETDRFTVALSERGRPLPPIHYAVGCTPVPLAIQHGVVRIPDGLGRDYPDDPFVAVNKLVSYLGLRLDGDYGAATGVYSVMDDKPIEDIEAVERVLRFFLARTSAELERAHKTELIELLRSEIDQLRESVDNPIRAVNKTVPRSA